LIPGCIAEQVQYAICKLGKGKIGVNICEVRISFEQCCLLGVSVNLKKEKLSSISLKLRLALNSAVCYQENMGKEKLRSIIEVRISFEQCAAHVTSSFSSRCVFVLYKVQGGGTPTPSIITHTTVPMLTVTHTATMLPCSCSLLKASRRR
jgi:hypothetical protein